MGLAGGDLHGHAQLLHHLPEQGDCLRAVDAVDVGVVLAPDRQEEEGGAHHAPAGRNMLEEKEEEEEKEKEEEEDEART